VSNTTACVVVHSVKVFQRLGPKPLLRWSLEQLNRVRGIAKIVCVVTPDLFQKTQDLLPTGNEVVQFPKSIKDGMFDEWLTTKGPAKDAEIVLVVKPINPFLPAAKIEECLREVTKRKGSICCPARQVPILALNGTKKVIAKHAVDSVRVFRVNVPKEAVKFQTVSVGLLESLDVEQHDEFVLAAAIVAGDYFN